MYSQKRREKEGENNTATIKKIRKTIVRKKIKERKINQNRNKMDGKLLTEKQLKLKKKTE